MKAFFNIFLVLLVIVATVIPLGTCKPRTIERVTNQVIEHTTEEHTTAFINIESTTVIPHHRNIIKAPARNAKLGCPSGEKLDPRGMCRKVL
ncbi:uncharacterized protein LOC113004864 [Solenopsis invicta]|uniref:uncharacterized protein LOC113004864 n=1 Tax=Solenopsis invicta TaxID=13686 RepID=UPI00193DFC05|nr:uncharacterized protein LOC113004864 [Solenopsis invicta]